MRIHATGHDSDVAAAGRATSARGAAVSWAVLAVLAALGSASPVVGQGSPAPATTAPARGPESTEALLPPASVTRHELDLAGGRLRYTATAGALPVRQLSGRVLGEIAYVAYQREAEPEPARRRPVTFAFNGGPGAASAYLNLGAMGPRRIAFGRPGDGPSAPPTLLDNRESWLGFTDLVFIDPVGTGFSRFAPGADDARGMLWSVGGDYRSLSRFIANWLRANGRLGSPVYLVGESYGGFRAPKIAGELQKSDGVGVSGMVLISPVLDFTFQRDARDTPLKWAVALPSLAAARMERDGSLTPERLAEAEAYAGGAYLSDLLRGPRDPEARRRIVGRVAALTGLDPKLVEDRGGKIDSETFLREAGRAAQTIGSPYDSAATALDPAPDAARSRAPDAVLDAATAPLTSAMLIHYANDLNWRPTGRYILLDGEIAGRWNYGSGRGDRESMTELRGVLALDRNVRVLVTHGYTDLVTPYFESKLLLDQLPALGDPQRVRLSVFAGGHMFYSRDASRAALRDAAQELIEARQDL